MIRMVAIGFAVVSFLDATLAEPVKVNFQQEIAPIFSQRCVGCHSPGIRKGDVSLATIDDVHQADYVIPGDADASHLVNLITSVDGQRPEMPGEGEPLSDSEVDLIRRWIDQGADWPKDVVVREASKADSSWWSLQPIETSPVDASIDFFLQAKLHEQGLEFNPPADRATLIRRATYDLTGLPPTPAEIDSFVVDDTPGAYDRLIDRLLDSPAYGQRWGRHWLDVVRFGESNGFERNVIIDQLWPFRDYVIECINRDKPFDQFIREHIAGDVLEMPDATPQERTAAKIGSAFLVAGPYDDVGNQDAAQAAQIRANTLDEIVSATGQAFLGMTIACARCHDHKFDPITQKDYYGFTSTFAAVRHGAVPLVSEEEQAEPAPMVWIGRRVAADAKGPFHTFIGGNPARPGDPVVPSGLSALDQVTKPYHIDGESDEATRRRKLAQWITSDDNPLTPRVLANRIWHYHFGTGIVNTPNDLGYMGGRPSHPKLLDHLALMLKQSDWRIKPLHRKIMTSRAYRQSSDTNPDAMRIDGDNRLLWRFSPRRLSAEEVRDTMLWVAGTLDDSMGGPGFRLYQFSQDNVCTYVPLDKHGAETYRRAVYHQNARASVVDLMTEFDQPDCTFSSPRRDETTTPLQALTMLNHSFTIDMSEALADRVTRESGADLPGQVDRAFRLLYGRHVRDDELESMTNFVQEHSLAALARVLLNTSEMIYVR